MEEGFLQGVNPGNTREYVGEPSGVAFGPVGEGIRIMLKDVEKAVRERLRVLFA